MANFHRKILRKSPQILVVVKKPCLDSDQCEINLPPPPPPPPPPSPAAHKSFSPFLIFMFCGLAVSFSFIFYLTLYKRCCKSCNNSQRNPSSTDEIHEVFVDEDHGPVIHHPIWLIRTIGLEQSVIEAIEVFKYKHDEGLIEGTDCSVCLSEFQDDESLRLLPKCSHAFHVPCIDTWLQSHKNCPLCRAPIVKNTSDTQSDITVDQTLIESRSMEEIPDEDSESVDHVERNQTFEVENNGEESQPMEESSASINVPLPDQEKRSSDELVLSKRAHNMPKRGHMPRRSSSSISICTRVMKSSSFRSSSRKASSFIKRSCSSSGNYYQNRSY